MLEPQDGEESVRQPEPPGGAAVERRADVCEREVAGFDPTRVDGEVPGCGRRGQGRGAENERHEVAQK